MPDRPVRRMGQALGLAIACGLAAVLDLAIALDPAAPLGLGGPPAIAAEPRVEGPAPARPAPPPALPVPLTREAIRELLARLSDAEVRQLLMAQLDKAIPPAGPAPAGAAGPTGPAGPTGMTGMAGMGGMMMMDQEAGRVRDRLRAVLGSAARLPANLGAATARVTEGRDPGHLGRIALLFLLMLAIGRGVERLLGWLTADVRRRLREPHPGGAPTSAGQLVGRLVLDLLGLLVFALAAALTFFALYHGHDATRQLVVAALAGVVAVRLAALVARLLLSPRDPSKRLLAFDDRAARRLARGVVALAILYGVGDIGLGLLHVWGLPDDNELLLSVVVALVFLGLFLSLAWRSRGDIGALIRGEGAVGPFRRLLAELWPVLLTVYVAVVFLVGAFERFSGRPIGYAGILSLVVVVVLPLVDLALGRLLASAMRPADAGAAPAAASGYEPVLRRGIHIIVVVVGLLAIARLWGLDLFALSARSFGLRVTEALFSVAVTLLVAYLAWHLLKAAIDRRIAREAPPAAEPGAEGGGPGASRLRTMLPMVRAFVFVSLCAMATMIGLASLGVNIGPLLAGAGVVGIAVGFGAQTLVRDIVSGMFFLLDDAFRLGEYIDVGAVKGTVEKISLRSMQIRHHRGALHTVPYGQITRLTNESRDWTIVKLEFRLTYDTDLVKVKKILKRIGEELQQDPELGPSILQPLKSQGIMATDDSALVVRAKFMAKPGGVQYVIRREAFNRIVKAFAEQGIRFAHRQVTVFVPPGAAGAAAGAAATAPDAMGDGQTAG
jgi:small-conductance mechanosensitive channel